MPPCFRIEGFEVTAENVVKVRANLHPRQINLTQILMSVFPGAVVEIPDADPLKGLRILQAVWEVELVLSGGAPRGVELSPFLELLLAPYITVADRLDESHCLDFHQLPTEIPQEFRYTPIGHLVFRAKYRGDQTALASIAEKLTEFVKRHPRYDRAKFVTCVPRSSSRGWVDVAEPLARQLASALPKQRVILQRAQDVGSQKEVSEETERYLRQEGTMLSRDALDGQSVVVIDDMYGSGGSMQEAARVLRQAGAGEVLGLAATKTLKYTRGVSL